MSDLVVASSLPQELEVIAIAVAQQAAAIVTRAFGTASSIGTKSSDTDVVTQTDLDSEALLRDLLEAATPGCGIIGEEGGSTRLSHRLQWVIDPLDGTVNFLYGVPVCAVSVAAAFDGEFVAGAVVDCVRNETFSASAGRGARCNGLPIRGSTCDRLAGALVTTGFSYTARQRALQAKTVERILPAARDIRCFGSAALQLCWAASGRVDVYFERDTKIWDWAAGALIAAEAGLAVDLPCPENESLLLAAPKALLGELRELTFVGAHGH